MSDKPLEKEIMYKELKSHGVKVFEYKYSYDELVKLLNGSIIKFRKDGMKEEFLFIPREVIGVSILSPKFNFLSKFVVYVIKSSNILDIYLSDSDIIFLIEHDTNFDEFLNNNPTFIDCIDLHLNDVLTKNIIHQDVIDILVSYDSQKNIIFN